MMPAPKITLDTNSFINLFDRDSATATSVEVLSAIMRHSLSGKAEIAATTRVEADLAGDKNTARREKMCSFLALLPVVGTVLRWDTSTWDGGDFWTDEDMTALHQEIQEIVFPGLSESDRRYQNKLYDVDHLVGHKLNGRDIFVTEDFDIWRRRDLLQAAPGIVVMKPADCLAYVESIAPGLP